MSSCSSSDIKKLIILDNESDYENISSSGILDYTVNIGEKSNIHSRSGNYSVKLTPENPYGQSIIIKNLSPGEHLKATTWRHISNKKGSLVISCKDVNDLYITQDKPTGKWENDWEELQLDVIIPPRTTGKEIIIYVWNANDSVPMFFDDLTVEVIENKTTNHITGTLKDPRDNKIYKTIQIGEDLWMAENLSYNISGSKCYDRNDSLCYIIGRLYNYDQALISLPKGWKLPSDEDFMRLEKAIGLDDKEIKKYGDRGINEAWMLREGGSSGFEMIPAGAWNIGYYNLNFSGYLWTSTEIDTLHAYCREISHRADIGRFRDDKNMYFSVRGIKK